MFEYSSCGEINLLYCPLFEFQGRQKGHTNTTFVNVANRFTSIYECWFFSLIRISCLDRELPYIDKESILNVLCAVLGEIKFFCKCKFSFHKSSHSSNDI